MILILKPELTCEETQSLEKLAASSGRDFVFEPEKGRLRFLLEAPDPDLQSRAKLWPGVEGVHSTQEAFPLCKAKEEGVWISGKGPRASLFFGKGHLQWIAGPCSVEGTDRLRRIARAVRDAGATMLRGGAFKPRSSPYSFQGMGEEGLRVLGEIADEVRLPLVTEVMDPRQVGRVCEVADMLQIGSRSMQNFPLLTEVARSGAAVLLKRGGAASVDEFLGAVEYLFAAGSTQVVLCERGVRSFDPSRRNLLDLSIVPLLQERYSLPILVDPSHATGRRSLVAPMAKAAVASGADGVMVEVHDAPAEALSDAAQALKLHDLPRLGASLRLLAQVEGRKLGGSAEAGASPPAQEASSSRPTQAREDAFSFADPSRGPA
ncbi:MAG TPA: 3-deoxy-7-phosphoheptulonate synthase [Planctomycetes bacterium]|nr:3-deoxy-7-phosphoheptulonate synthase [Planctomycetota bacterium]